MTRDSAWLQHLGGEVRFRDAAGIRTRSLEAGSGSDRVVVMLHGTGGHAEAFLRNVVPLAERGYWTVAIDMVGHGLTDTPADRDYTIQGYVEHLLGLIDDLDLPATAAVHVAGESLGGWVALQAALSAPDRVRSVVNVVGGGLRPIPPTSEELEGWSTLGKRSRTILAAPTWDDWRRRMDWLVHDPASMPDEIVAVRSRLYENPDLRAAQQKVVGRVLDRAKDGKVPESLGPEELGTIPCPVLYLWTDHNPTTPARVARAAHEITPNSEFVLFENCGHWPQLEDAERFNDVVDDFLSRIDAAAR